MGLCAGDFGVMGSDDTKTCKVDRLRAAAALAPVIRAGGGRRWKVVDKSGKVVGEIDQAKLLVAIAERTDIEIAIVDGARKPHRCVDCLMSVIAKPKRAPPLVCAACKATRRRISSAACAKKKYYENIDKKRERSRVAHKAAWKSKDHAAKDRINANRRARRAAKKAGQ